ncbi:ubiquitin-related modifier 1 isoform X3 [Amblyraja radiata]|uniref:ubiquitin-related modifier 1 isoform X3 n=1 Tax=Amblyraja radiata TaxID=386614 RepID=UPI00140387AD|nr:ubiquitin-related modifier 1 isoform X3 [Amblyraja radiata]
MFTCCSLDQRTNCLTHFRVQHNNFRAGGSKMAASIGVHLEFRGGAELLFNGAKEQHVTLPSQPTPWQRNGKYLTPWCCSLTHKVSSAFRRWCMFQGRITRLLFNFEEIK